jgi:hypothetical protein
VIPVYDKELTETSKGALVELMLALGSYRDNFVLVGGWPPYFLTRQHFDHCESIDLDFVLRPSIMLKYQSIREIVNSLGYKETPNIFRFERALVSTSAKRKFSMHLDFLTEPDAALKAIQESQLVDVQQDLKACLIKGSSIVFDFNYNESVNATIPGDGEAQCDVLIANIVGSLTMKGQALMGRFKDKDYYDVYAVAGFHNGGPKSAADVFFKSLKQRKFNVKDPLLFSSLSTISRSFEKVSSMGPFMVSRFVGGDVGTDAYERVNTFLRTIESDFQVRF